jgi:hypothetical protein
MIPSSVTMATYSELVCYIQPYTCNQCKRLDKHNLRFIYLQIINGDAIS